jgi:ubiquinol-cytochrome c reductase iron-sulfur subunit
MTDQPRDDRIRTAGPTGSTDVPENTPTAGDPSDADLMRAGGGGENAPAPALAEREARPGGELEQRFANPGVPDHSYRRSDVDAKAAKRREREVAAFFGFSTLFTLLFIVGYFAVKLPGDGASDLNLSNKLLGIGLGGSLFLIGAGAVHWAKTLMPDDEVVSERKPMRSSEADRADAVAVMKEGAAGAGLGRRKLIRNSLLGALAPLGLVAIIPLRDLGPLPGAALEGTAWRRGRRLLTDPTGRPIRAADLRIGEVVHVLPEGIEEYEEPLDEKAKATTLVIRLEPDELVEEPDRAGWSYNGIVAYSKVCTHVGCPVALYEQQTHHLLCPCHQSTFDVAQHAKVIFGPAARPLPQLPLDVDDEGYLIAAQDFQEPVGPSFWERGE